MVDPTNSSSTPVQTTAPAQPSSGNKTRGERPIVKPPVTAATGKPTPRTMAALAAHKRANFSTMPFWAGLSLSMLWVGIVLFAIMASGGAQTFAGLPLVNWAIGISAAVSPVAMIWMVAAYLQRAADVQSVTEPLRRQLAMITGESGAAEVRVRRFNQAVKEQLELLRSTKHVGDDEMMAIAERINEHRVEFEQFEQQSAYQIEEIQAVIRHSMQHIEKMMDDKFSLLRVLDGKLTQNGEEVARQTQTMRDNVAALLHEVESHSETIASSVEKALSDSKKLSDTARAQETSLISAAETAYNTLQELSGRIDTNIAHFLGRTGLAREEAERLAAAIDTQTRSLDELSTVLPTRIGEAETVLRGVADRLYASEQLAREQATHLSDKLAAQIDGMQGLMDRFASRVNEIDGGLQQRRSDLDGLVVRISGATNDLAQQLDTAVSSMGTRAEESLRKFHTANAEAKQGVEDVAKQLTETALRYEAATQRLGSVSEANNAQMRASTLEIAEQLKQFDALQNASQQAGREVQNQAALALQNMQQVLERLLATRDATQSVGEVLTDKLRTTADNNERVIARINEAARMSVHALSTATEALGQQEKGLVSQTTEAEELLRGIAKTLQEQAQESEKALRGHNDSLTILASDIQDRLDKTDKRLQDFADYASAPVQKAIDQIDASTTQGRSAMDAYGKDMHGQLEKLQAFNTRVSEMGQDVSRMTEGTLKAIEDLTRRFDSVRTAQEETSRTSAEQFTSMAERLQREIDHLGSKSAEAAAILQEAAVQVGKNTYQLQTESQDSGAKIQAVTTALQNEAVTMRSTLEKQAADINAELSRVGSTFNDLGQQLKEKTESAYALLDRVAVHYNDITRVASDEFEGRATKLEETATQAIGKVQSLSSVMESQIVIVDEGAKKVEQHATNIAAASDKAIDRTEQLGARFSVLQTSALDGTERVVGRMEEAAKTFKEHNDHMAEATDGAVTLIQRAGGAFGEQASRMLDTTHQIEASIRGLNLAASDLAEQSTQIRTSMDEHNGRLISNIKESIERLDSLNTHLQVTTASAIQGADQATTRFNDLANTATVEIQATTKDLSKIADETQSSLAQLGSGITQQVAALNLVGEQITEQHKLLTQTNDRQREQLLDLFQKLGAAHNEASGVAERTIQRLDDTLTRVQEHLGQLSDHSQTTLASVTQAGSGFAEEATKLVAHAKEAEEQARTATTVTASLQEQARQLRDALQQETDRASDMLSTLLGRLTSGSGDMRDISANASAALSDLQMGIAKQSASLGETMDHIALRQQTLINALDAQRETLAGLITRLSMAQDETAAAAESAATRLSESANRVTTQIDTIGARTETSLAAVQAASERFTQESATLAACAEKVETQTNRMAEQAHAASEQAKNAGNVLDVTVAKIETGAGKLREAGQSTEATLTHLNHSITQQATAIHGNLESMAERQTTLTSALDVQRDMLASMITRLALAQDETASAAERSASRLSDSAGQITRQMEQIDTQTQNALAAVRAASTGLADESSAIGQHTQKAEQQIRDMLATTHGLHDEARQAREATQTETTQIVEQLRTVMAQIDATILSLKQQSSTVTGTMDQTALDFTAMAKNAGDTLQLQANNLSTVSSQAEQSIAAVSDRIRENSKVISDASALTQEHGLRLTETAEGATSSLVTLISKMSDSDRTAQAIIEKASNALTETRTRLESELQTIADLSGRAVEKLMGAGSTLAIQSDALRANLSSSESALTQAADLLRQETTQLPSVLDRSVKHIEDASRTYKTQTAEIGDSMIKTTDRCIGAAGALRDTMMDEARHMTEVVEIAQGTLGAFNNAVTAQIASIKTCTGELTDEQKSLVEKTAQALTDLAAAGERLSGIKSEAIQTSTKLVQELSSIEARAESTTQKLSSAGDNLTKQVGSLIQMTEKAENHMLTASQGFREQLERVRGGVQTQIEDINRGLMQITAQLDRTGTSLRQMMAGTVVDVEKIAGRLDQSSKDMSNQMTDRTARMRGATEEVAKLLGNFSTQIDVLLDRLDTAGGSIKRQETDFVGHLQQAFSHLGSVAERLESTRVLAGNVTEAAVSKLGEVNQTIDKQMRGMAEGGQKVAGIIQSVAQTYADQVQKVNGTVLDSQQQIVAMTKAIEDMQQRTDRMRVTLKLQGDDLMGSLEGILAKLSGAGDAMSDAIDGTLQQQAINSLKKFS